MIKSLTTEIDSFTCEHGVYSLENCYTARPSKKFSYQMTAKIYELGPGDEEVGPIASAIGNFKIPYRPSTNVSCPATSEGKGFGPNCDVGGFLATVRFKRFRPAAVLPEQAIITITSAPENPPRDIVNVGLQASYKEYEGGEFVAEPAADGGVPAVGSDPLPNDAFVKDLLDGGWEGFQPVFEVNAVQ